KGRIMRKYFVIFLMVMFLSQCDQPGKIEVVLENPIELNRENETIEIRKRQLHQINPEIQLDSLQVINSKGETIPSQIIDSDQNNESDLLIFQTILNPNEKQKYKLIAGSCKKNDPKTYARFVPERENDFAWENDRIAYRMYSKKLEKKEGTDSGIDVWAISVSDLIIDKWYKNGHYHTDHGEGLDFYKVGPTRGCGSLSILKDGEMYGSGGFIDWKIITNGPIRSTFELSYAPIEIDGKQYRETKRISLDAGWNLNRIESEFEAENDCKIAIGLAIHEDQGQGSVKYNGKLGYASFWEPATKGNGNLGTAIVIENDKYLNGKKIENHHAIITSCNSDNKVSYYAGAGWDKSKYFSDKKSWNKYIQNLALRVKNPVKVKLR
ncbi:MAG TPA: DUF4861 family protein, partial [bacterium]|nr:DUF4861 family protein [bacterium]